MISDHQNEALLFYTVLFLFLSGQNLTVSLFPKLKEMKLTVTSSD